MADEAGAISREGSRIVRPALAGGSRASTEAPRALTLNYGRTRVASARDRDSRTKDTGHRRRNHRRRPVPTCSPGRRICCEARTRRRSKAGSFLGAVDAEGMTVQLDAVHALDGLVGGCRALVADVSEAARLTGRTVGNDDDLDEVAEPREERAQVPDRRGRTETA